MNRREVLKAIALTAPLTVGGRLYAAPWTSTRLLVVFLRGAYDAANVVVPVSSDFYYQSRPTLAIARPIRMIQMRPYPLIGIGDCIQRSKKRFIRSTKRTSLLLCRSQEPTTPAVATSKHRTRLSWGKRSMGHEISNRDL